MMPTIADRFAEIRTLDPADIARIADTYHAWRGDDSDYADLPGFCKAAPLAEVRDHGHGLTPGRYVGAEAAEADDEPIEEKIERLKDDLLAEFDRGRELEAAVRDRLGGLQ